MKLNNTQIRKVINGSTILGTGGGGRLDSALEVISKITSIELISVEALDELSVVITAYGAGGLTKPKITDTAIKNGLKLLETRLNKQIAAIIPVEIGPYSLALAFEMAQILDLPVIDGDLVGYRSVPDIYIELVTLSDLSRCPLVFGNNEGDRILLDEVSTAERLEQIIRTFADSSLSNTFVLGYPFQKAVLSRCTAVASVSYCLDVQERLDMDFTLVCSGKITQDKKQELNGFTTGYIIVESKASKFRVEYKNENLVLLKDAEVLVTCPDFICVIDDKFGLGINNGDNNKGKSVSIYVRPAIQQWRTKIGLSLFSPEKLGLDYKQKILAS